VLHVTQLLTLHLGPDFIVLAMKVAFAPDLTVARIEEVINEIERGIRGAHPQMKKIFVEPDSRGDGRGVASLAPPEEASPARRRARAS
jgi:divalent metal cation (Fe/Co/Zn/Cd) transporter